MRLPSDASPALPPPLSTFFRAYDALSRSCTSYPWGTVTRNPRYAHVWDANRAWIHGVTSPSLAELADAIVRAQQEFAVDYTHVEVIDTDARAGLVDQLGGWLDPTPERFVLMAIDGASPAGPRPVPAVEILDSPFPGAERWLALVRAGHADDEQLPDAVIEEFVERDCGPLAAAGMRLLTAQRQHDVAAFAALLSLEGVGLVDGVATLPHYRRLGLATSLVAAAIEVSRSAGNHTTILFTREGSDAQRLYTRLGMRVAARVAQFHREGAAIPEAG